MPMKFRAHDTFFIRKYIKMSEDESDVAIRSLNDDFACIVNTYLPRYKSNPAKFLQRTISTARSASSG